MKESVVSILSFLYLLASRTWAAPTLTVSLLNGRSVLRVSRTHKNGCTYRLMAATSNRNLINGDFINVRNELRRESMTSKIPVFRRKGGKTLKAYFVLREVCGQASSDSAPQTVSFPTRNRQRKVSAKSYLKKVGSMLGGVQSEAKLTEVLKDISFSRPVALTNAGDSRLFVVEQEGLVLVFDSPESTSRRVFLDLTSKTGVTGNERGLFAIAFHPNHAENRRFFVHYTAKRGGDSIVEQYKYSQTNENKADPSTARTILRVSQPFSNHNGGAMMFGPDGYLYISLGDGGSAGDPQGNSQNRRTLLGKILRIDVDKSENGERYGIPRDNPFNGRPRARKEIFAYGARNIWKFSFDATLGTLWAGDVGQNAREEVSIVPMGANLGWNIAEGTACFQPSDGCDRSGLTEPVLDYDHSEGRSITGGYVYRGAKIPGLHGYYVFADYLGGNSPINGGVLWAIPALNPSPRKGVINNKRLFVTGFGEDVKNELYVLSFFPGNPSIKPAIHRIDPL